MQPLGCIMRGSRRAPWRLPLARKSAPSMDSVFRALADPSRRRLLDRRNQRNGQSLTELCAGLDMARQSVTKHLKVLEEADLITIAWQGREKLHHLNAAPINDIADRWIAPYHRRRARALADLKRALESNAMGQTEFRYVTYINTTPEQLWRALTEPSFTLQYWGIGMRSDWKVGSPIELQWRPDAEFRDIEQGVLESEPFRRLAYHWPNHQREHAARFGWPDERSAEHLREP